MSPASHMLQPTKGILKSEALPSHFISHGSKEMMNGSALDSWLLTTTVRGAGGTGLP